MEAIISTDEKLALLQMIFARSSDGYAFLDTKLILRAANESFAKQIDLPVDQIVGQPLEKVFPGWTTELEQTCAEIKETGNFFRKTYPFIAGDLPERSSAYREVTISPLYAPNAVSLGYLIESCQRKKDETTERLLAEENCGRLAAIVESSDAAIIGKTLDGIITSWNKGAGQIYGYSAEEVLGKPISVIVPPDYAKEVTGILEKVKLGDHIKLQDTMRVRKDGTLIQVAVTVSPIKNARGEIIGASTIARDITERRQADRARERLVAILEATTDFVGTADAEGHLLYHNRAARRMLGVGADEDISNLRVADAHPGWARDIVLHEGIPAALCDGIWGGETALLSRDGREIPVSQVIIAHKLPDGTVEFLSTIARDITERKQLIEQLTASALAAQESAQSEQALREELEVQNEEIQSQDEELRALNEELEALVREKTEELEQSNAALRDEIEVRKRVEEGLRFQEELSRGIIDAAPFGAHLYELKPDGRLVFTSANRSADRILGVSNQQFIGKTIEEAFPALIETEVPDAYRRVAGLGEPYETEQVDYDEQGIRGAFEVHAFQTGTNQMAAFFRDITERKKAEEALRESEERYRQLVEFSPVAIAVHRQGRIVFANAAALRLIGATDPEELIGKPLMDFVHPSSHELVQERIRRATAKGRVSPLIEEKFIRIDGAVIDVEVASMPLIYHGEPSIMVVFRDVTERKRAADALRESEERYRTLVSTSPDAIMLIDINTTVLMCNQRAAEMLGYERPNDLLGKHALDFVVPEEQQVAAFNLRSLQGTRIVRNIEHTLLRKDGSQCPVELSASLITDSEGNPSAIVALARDITERRQAEAKLRRLRRDWEDIFRSIGDPTLILDRDHRVKDANNATVNMIGKPLEELLGKYCYEVVHGTDRPAEHCPLARTLSFKQHESQEIDLFCHGDIFLVSCTLVFDEAGEIERIIHIATDISKLKKAEQALEQSVTKLERTLDGTIQAMAKTVEIRDPYTAGHQRRVAQLAYAIAEELSLSAEQIQAINMAAAIHDIGKIYVPAEILSKPGRLTENEFAMIKGHCRLGHDILKTIKFPWPIGEIVYQHHERLDGSGYPLGLSVGEILLEARVIAVADVVEAMASHRPYRPALGIDKALEEISTKRGLLYDPTVVDACLKVFEKGAFKFVFV